MRLYGLPEEKVDVVIHRQSIVHSLVEFCDGAMLAQLGVPDMRIPIQLALTYPERLENPAEGLDLLTCGPLSFQQPDTDAFECLRIARQTARESGTACTVMNGANEAAVGLFLEGRAGFCDIPALVKNALDTVAAIKSPSLEEILAADKAAREAVYHCL